MSAIDDQKGVVRAAARATRRSIPAGTRADYSVLICAHIESSELWSSARVVTAFLPIQSEVDLLPLLVGRLGGRTLGIPRTENDVMTFDSVDLHNPDGLHIGEFGITVARRQATIDPVSVDLVLVPMLAFDRTGNRLGAGRAFYDRWLPSAVHAFRLGVAFSAQEMPAVPVDGYDARLDAVVTEAGILVV